MARPPCTSRSGEHKKRWPNRDSAVFVAHKVASTSPYSQAVYHCEHCDGWHLATHQEGTRYHLPQDIVVHGDEVLYELIPSLAARR